MPSSWIPGDRGGLENGWVARVRAPQHRDRGHPAGPPAQAVYALAHLPDVAALLGRVPVPAQVAHRGLLQDQPSLFPARLPGHRGDLDPDQPLLAVERGPPVLAGEPRSEEHTSELQSREKLV